VFAGSFDPQAAEDICNRDLAPEDIVDLLSALARREEGDAVRFWVGALNSAAESVGRCSGRRRRLPSQIPTVNRSTANMRCGRWELVGGGTVARPCERVAEGRPAADVRRRRSTTGCGLEGLAWIAAENGDYRRAAMLTGAAETLGSAVGASTVVLPHLLGFHIEGERPARKGLGAEGFEAARQEGREFGFNDAVTCALGKPPSSPIELSPQVR
jgi:hypothetical protein